MSQFSSPRVPGTLGLLVLATFPLFAGPAAPRFSVGFTANPQPAASPVLFTTNGPGYSLRLMRTEAVLHGAATFRLKWLNANPRPEVHGEVLMPGLASYFFGNDPKRWRTGLGRYREVRYSKVYPGIDLVFHTRGGELEYDWIVSAGADPAPIQFEFPGASAVRLDSDGDLLVRVDGNEIRQRRPRLFQSGGEIAGGYILDRNRVSFYEGPYDRRRPLVIDPIVTYSTLLGGAGNDGAFGLAVDKAGNAYIAGLTLSADLPSAPRGLPVPKKSFAGATAFVAKLNPAGTDLVYLAYLGGSGADLAMAIAVDGSGAAYVTGGTTSADFPTTAGAAQRVYGGTGGSSLPPLFQPSGDAFVAKLNPAGDALVYSTFLGGPGKEQGYGIAVDAAGNAYVAGTTDSDRFPVTPQAVQSRRAGSTDGFIAKLNAAGTAPIYSSFLGGRDEDYVFGLSLDAAGGAYVTGLTASRAFPVTAGAAQTAYNGSPMAFVTKLNPPGTDLAYSSFLGGSRYNAAYGIAVDAEGSAYVTGVTNSADFPVTPGAFAAPKRSGGSLGDVFAAKMTQSGDGLVYASVFGGLGSDYGTAIALDGGRAYVTGRTAPLDRASNFPTTANATQRCGSNDAFVTALDADGSALIYSSRLGGTGASAASAIAIGADGGVWIAGSTASPDFPVTPAAFQSANKGQGPGAFDSDSLMPFGGDVFLARIDVTGPPALRLGCVVNAASFALGPVSPGAMVSILGGGLGSETGGDGAISDGRYETSIGGTRVLFAGIAAPLLYARSDQINAVVPFGVQGPTTEIQIEYNGERSNTITVPVVDATPGMFTLDGSGVGPGLIYNEDGSTNSAQNPARPGSLATVLVTGLGQTDPRGEDGKFNSEPFPTPLLPVSVLIAGSETEILPAHFAPLAPGVFPVRFRIPPELPPSDATRVIVVQKASGFLAAQDFVTMSVR